MKYTHLVFLSFLILSCSDTGNEVVYKSQNFSINKYSEEITNNLYLKEMETLRDAAFELSESTSECTGGIREVQIAEYRELWLESMMAFHRVHPHLKSGILTLDFLEQDVLIDRIYRGSFGSAFCEVQAKMIDQTALVSSNLRVLGLSALESALYGDLTSENSCNPRSQNFEKVELWLANTSEENRANDLCKYINKVSLDLVEVASSQIQRANDVKNESGVQALYTESALQKIYDSLSQFVKEEFLGVKINQPLGINSLQCPFANRTCPYAVEHRLSNLSFLALRNNLYGLEKIFKGFGETDSGLNHYLRINGHDALVDEINDLIFFGQSVADEFYTEDKDFFKLSQDLNSEEGKVRCRKTTLENKLEPVCVLPAFAKRLSELLNIDLKAALAVSSTNIIEGDSD